LLLGIRFLLLSYQFWWQVELPCISPLIRVTVQAVDAPNAGLNRTDVALSRGPADAAPS